MRRRAASGPMTGMPRSAYGDESYDLSPGYRAGVQDTTGIRSMLFAGTVLGLIGVFNVFEGVAALGGSNIYRDHLVMEFGSVRLWGGVLLFVGLLELVASFAIFTKSAAARWFGVAAAVVNAWGQLLALGLHPWWAICAFAADILVVKALLDHGGRALASR